MNESNIEKRAIVVRQRMTVEAKLRDFEFADRLTEEQAKEKRRLEGELTHLKRREEELSRPGGFEIDEVITCGTIEDINRAVRLVKKIPLDTIHEVVIRPGKRQRRPAQNRIYWKWCTEIGDHLGLGKEDCSEMLKEKYLLNIFVRDDEDYALMAGSILVLKKHDFNAWCFLRKQVIRLTSTTACSVKQMSEYLTSIKRFAAKEEIEITIPEDKEIRWMLSW